MRALWGEDVKAEGTSRVTWEIEPVGDSCHLTVTHDQLREGANEELYGGWPRNCTSSPAKPSAASRATSPGRPSRKTAPASPAVRRQRGRRVRRRRRPRLQRTGRHIPGRLPLHRPDRWPHSRGRPVAVRPADAETSGGVGVMGSAEQRRYPGQGFIDPVGQRHPPECPGRGQSAGGRFRGRLRAGCACSAHLRPPWQVRAAARVRGGVRGIVPRPV
jgi:hypothetical protein